MFVRTVFSTEPSLEQGVFVWDSGQLTEVLSRAIFPWKGEGVTWIGRGWCKVFRIFKSSSGSSFLSVSMTSSLVFFLLGSI